MKLKSFFIICLLVTVNSISAFGQTVIPSGETVGVSIKTSGLLITGTSDVKDVNGKSIAAARKAGLKPGDRIISVDGNAMSCIEDFSNYVSSRTNEIVLSIIRNEKTVPIVIKPVQTENGCKIGVWVRDSTAGIGTITYIDPENSTFAGLGHGISDIDTGDILTVKSGNILSCSVSTPTKGKNGEPGELNGIFTNVSLGEVTQNTQHGILGNYSSPVSTETAVEVAPPSDIETGEAEILANVDGCGVQHYKINVKRILGDDPDGKNMIIEVSDEALLNKTGGIVRGMSGAPILQNGKLIGAVTHVFVNNPTQGYAIFAENMVDK